MNAEFFCVEVTPTETLSSCAGNTCLRITRSASMAHSETWRNSYVVLSTGVGTALLEFDRDPAVASTLAMSTAVSDRCCSVSHSPPSAVERVAKVWADVGGEGPKELAITQTTERDFDAHPRASHTLVLLQCLPTPDSPTSQVGMFF